MPSGILIDHPWLAEFVGTTMLVLLGNGVVANVLLARSKGHGAGWLVICLGWGLAVALSVYTVGRISGAHLNPAVTVGLASIDAFPWADVPAYALAQLAGAFLGSVLVFVTYFAHWPHTDDPAVKLACHCTSPAVRSFAPSVVTEVIGTAMLVFGVLALGSVVRGAGDGQEAWAAAVGTWFGPLLVGLLVCSIGLSLGGPTGWAINPARDLGPRLAHAVLPIHGRGPSDWGYAWVPALAPLGGGALGAVLFRFLGL